ncbi:MAG: RNase adapter RapZ [Proteobacteria bacterium]|nr:RNase adapter RapZ [Pseudomonadota bacterium]
MAAKNSSLSISNAGGRTPLLIVSGVSGAGKSSTLKLLEDLGYEAVDNMPMSLLGRLVPDPEAPAAERRPIAVGVDIRTRDFDATRLLQFIEQIGSRADLAAALIFLDCDDEVLGRRFEETRRRHPLAADRPVKDGLARERRIMAPVRERADVVIDTSEFVLGDLKARLQHAFGLVDDPGLAIFVSSFSFKRGLPRDADLVFDVRFLKNPHYDPKLKPQTGKDAAVGRYIETDPAFDGFWAHLVGLIEPLLPKYRAEGKSYLTVAFGCTGGRHRSVFVAGKFQQWLDGNGWQSLLRHRDLDN